VRSEASPFDLLNRVLANEMSWNMTGLVAEELGHALFAAVEDPSAPCDTLLFGQQEGGLALHAAPANPLVAISGPIWRLLAVLPQSTAPAHLARLLIPSIDRLLPAFASSSPEDTAPIVNALETGDGSDRAELLEKVSDGVALSLLAFLVLKPHTVCARVARDLGAGESGLVVLKRSAVQHLSRTVREELRNTSQALAVALRANYAVDEEFFDTVKAERCRSFDMAALLDKVVPIPPHLADAALSDDPGQALQKAIGRHSQ
jgi:hypothetical protein